MDDERERIRAELEPQVYRGRVARDATSENVGLWVYIDSLNPNRAVGPCPWTAQVLVGPEPNAVVMPVKGDRVWVLLDETGGPVVVCHWPY